jgi:hypothetical protein
MITSVRRSIPGTPPETGASIQDMPQAARSRSAMVLVAAGLMLEWSIRIFPGAPAAAMPSSPNATASTAAVSVTHRMTTRQLCATAAGEAASRAPAARSGSSLLGLRFHATTAWPAARSWRTMAPPIRPVPMKPTASAIQFSCTRGQAPAGLPA